MGAGLKRGGTPHFGFWLITPRLLNVLTWNFVWWCFEAIGKFSILFHRFGTFSRGQRGREAERGAKPSPKLNALLDACSQHTTNTKYIVHTHIITSPRYITWSMKREAWNVKCETWSMKREEWNMKHANVKCVKCETWSMKHEVWNMKHAT